MIEANLPPMTTKNRSNQSHEDALTGAVLDDLARQGLHTCEQARMGTRVLDGAAWRGPGSDKLRAAQHDEVTELVVVETKQHLTAPLLGQALVGVLLAKLRINGPVRGIAAFAQDNHALRALERAAPFAGVISFDHRPQFTSPGNYKGEMPWEPLARWLGKEGWLVEEADLGSHGFQADRVHVGRRNGETRLFTSQRQYAVGRSSVGRIVCGRVLLGIEDATIVTTDVPRKDMLGVASQLKIEVVNAAGV